MKPLIISDLMIRCGNCNKLLAEKVSRPWTIRCPRCKVVNDMPGPGHPRSLLVETNPEISAQN